MALDSLAFLIAIISILLQVLDSWRGGQYTALGYDYTIRRRAFPKTSSEFQRIQTVVNDDFGKQIYRVQMRLQNTGKSPIQSSDFERPISLTLQAPSRLLFVEIVQASHKSLHPKVTFAEHTVTLEPLLLNPEDWIVLHLWVTKKIHRLDIDTRIVGVSAPQDLYTRQKNIERLGLPGLIMIAVYFLPQVPMTVRMPLVLFYDLYGIYSVIRWGFSLARTIVHRFGA